MQTTWEILSFGPRCHLIFVPDGFPHDRFERHPLKRYWLLMLM
jgi:hypothetical protein